MAVATISLLVSNIAWPSEPTLMEMNDPRYLLANFGPWQVHETEHFIFRSSGNVNIESPEIRALYGQQEANWWHLVRLMDLPEETVLPKINYWLFQSQEEKFLKTKVAFSAHSLHEYWSVYHRLDNATGAHELGHLFAIEYWGFIPKDEPLHYFLSEGWAYFVDDGVFWSWEPHEEARKGFAAGGKYRVEAVCCDAANEVDPHVRAVIASSFVKYLVQVHGVKKFGELYRAIADRRGIETFDAVYEMSFDELMNAYYKALKVLPSPQGST